MKIIKKFMVCKIKHSQKLSTKKRVSEHPWFWQWHLNRIILFTYGGSRDLIDPD